jgi:tagatose-1,6-bisphosphate aldolase
MASSAFDVARGLLAQTLTCDQVRKELVSQAGSLDGQDELVHLLEHFVADQDIRERDTDYAKWQEAELRKMLMPDGS